MVLCYGNPQKIGAAAIRPLQELADRENGLVEQEVFGIEDFQSPPNLLLPQRVRVDARINLQIGLSEWGTIESPQRAFYGQMNVADIAGWSHYGRRRLTETFAFIVAAQRLTR